MKKILFLVLALSVFVVANASAAGQAYLWGGYTTVKMKSLNRRIEGYISDIGSKNPKVLKLKDAFIIGADYLCDVSETVKIGPRVAFLLVKGKVSDHHLHIPSEPDLNELTGSQKTLMEVDNHFDSSLVPIMFGGSYNKNISDKFSLNGKLFFGYGLIKYKTKAVSRLPLEESGEKIDLAKGTLDVNGGCFVADISIGAQHWLTKRLGLGLDLGYRFTPETKLEGRAKIKAIGGKVEEIKDLVKVDFSGLTTKLSLSYKI